MAEYQQKDFHTVTPYIYGRLDLIDFLKNAFGAEERFRGTNDSENFHAELKIGDSILMLGIGKATPNEFGPPSMWGKQAGNAPAPATLYVYVPDADAAYKRALSLGGVSLGEPEQAPWGDRIAGVADPYGNKWWVATFKGAK
jgi:PhnB protein